MSYVSYPKRWGHFASMWVQQRASARRCPSLGRCSAVRSVVQPATPWADRCAIRGGRKIRWNPLELQPSTSGIERSTAGPIQQCFFKHVWDDLTNKHRDLAHDLGVDAPSWRNRTGWVYMRFAEPFGWGYLVHEFLTVLGKIWGSQCISRSKYWRFLQIVRGTNDCANCGWKRPCYMHHISSYISLWTRTFQSAKSEFQIPRTPWLFVSCFESPLGSGRWSIPWVKSPFRRSPARWPVSCPATTSTPTTRTSSGRCTFPPLRLGGAGLQHGGDLGVPDSWILWIQSFFTGETVVVIVSDLNLLR